jgi:hypothetical protein
MGMGREGGRKNHHNMENFLAIYLEHNFETTVCLPAQQYPHGYLAQVSRRFTLRRGGLDQPIAASQAWGISNSV